MNEAIQTTLFDPSVMSSTLFCISALFGQILHTVKKWAEGYHYTHASIKRFIAAIIGNFTGIIGFVSTGALDGMQIGTLIAFGLFMGLSANSIINKGERTEWSYGQRLEKVMHRRKGDAGYILRAAAITLAAVAIGIAVITIMVW